MVGTRISPGTSGRRSSSNDYALLVPLWLYLWLVLLLAPWPKLTAGGGGQPQMGGDLERQVDRLLGAAVDELTWDEEIGTGPIPAEYLPGAPQ